MRATVAALLLFLSSLCQAALVETDWHLGDSLVVRDTATGLDWLKPKVTLGLSFDEVLGQTDPLDVYAGWRFASLTEVLTLFESSAGIAVPDLDSAFESVATKPFIELFDPTFELPGIVFVGGKFDTGDPLTDGLARILYNEAGTGGGAIELCCNSRTEGNVELGSFLVRPVSVPEPGTLALFGAGLAGLGFRWGKRRWRPHGDSNPGYRRERAMS